MSIVPRTTLAFVAGLMASTTIAFAQDVHVHGHAELAIALDPSGELVAEFRSPMANIVGFEYEPQTDEEQAVVADAEAVLLDGGALFAFSEGAACTLNVASLDEGEHDHDEHHDTHDDHANHDDRDSHDDHEDHSGHDDHDHENVHSDVTVTYSYACEAPSELTNVAVRYFEHFPGIEEIDFVFLDENTQVARELSASEPSAAW